MANEIKFIKMKCTTCRVSCELKFGYTGKRPRKSIIYMCPFVGCSEGRPADLKYIKERR
jgi:hypothetical protein